jgi:hypothetical protein
VAEMRFLKAVEREGCTREDRIRHELQMYFIKNKLHETGIKWKEHTARMHEDKGKR